MLQWNYVSFCQWNKKKKQKRLKRQKMCDNLSLNSTKIQTSKLKQKKTCSWEME